MPAASAAGVSATQTPTSWHEARFHSLQNLPVPVRELAVGGVAGGFSKTCVAPLERCKILFQTGRIQPGSVYKALQGIFSSEGMSGLFRGNGASVLRIVPYSALYMSSYERYRRMLVDLRFMASHHVNGRVSPVVDLVAGSSAGATAVIVTYPLDLVRTRMAFMTESRPTAGHIASSSSPAAASSLNRAVGHPGSSSTASSSSAAGGGYLRRFSRMQLPSLAGNYARAPSRITVSMSHAAAPPASCATSVYVAARHSAAAVRRLHAANPSAGAISRHRHTIAGVLASTLRQEGIRGVYHGIGPSLYGILPYAGLKFYMYQTLKGRFHSLFPERMTGAKNNRLPVQVMLTYGGVAGLVAQTATYPLDVVRRRMQVEGLVLAQQAVQQGAALHSHPPFAFRSTPQALMSIAQKEGWRALFAGLSINYMKVVPSTAIGFAIYDYLKAHLDLSSNL